LKDQLAALKEASETSAKTSGQAGTSRKSNKNPKETTVEAREEGSATLRTAIKAELKQALEAVEEATTKCDKAAEDMFQLYTNLLSVDARYAWNKIVHEQTNANPYMDLQGLTRKRPRGMSRKSFEDCVTFHVLTVFPNNAAEQER
jgi:flagellar hook-basal body complex protein FliE